MLTVVDHGIAAEVVAAIDVAAAADLDPGVAAAAAEVAAARRGASGTPLTRVGNAGGFALYVLPLAANPDAGAPFAPLRARAPLALGVRPDPGRPDEMGRPEHYWLLAAVRAEHRDADLERLQGALGRLARGLRHALLRDRHDKDRHESPTPAA